MAYQFHENEQELEPQASGSRNFGPPTKRTVIDVLDSPDSATRQPRFGFSAVLLGRIFAGVLLALIAAGLIFLIFVRQSSFGR